MSKYANYNEELGINSVNDVGIYATGENLKKYIPSMEDRDLEKFIIIKSKLLYVGTDEKETEIANRLGIGGGEATSDAGATVKEVQTIVDGVVEVSEDNKSQIPKDDTDKVNEPEHTNDKDGLIGTRLFDRSGLNLTKGTWNILIEYNNQNKETARYGSGYYWLKKGEKYVIKGTEIEFKNDYVVNYKDEEFAVLSGRAVNWNENATLGVSKYDEEGNDRLPLNLDPMTLANGVWEDNGEEDEVNGENFYNFKVDRPDGSKVDTGIQKVGDVEYDSINKALKFNENEKINPEGEGGYLKLSKDNLDFSNGFTFEIYCNLSRLAYDNGSQIHSERSSFFCRMPSLKENHTAAMRFGLGGSEIVAKFCPSSGFDELVGLPGETYTNCSGTMYCKNNFKIESDFYLTVVYYNFNCVNEADRDYSFVQKNKADKIIFYENGEELGSTFLKNEKFNEGAEIWNSDCPFFIGVSPWDGDGNLYFTKGSIYTTRLYEISLTPNQVKLNYDMTLKYRDSFKDEKF